MSLYLSTAKSVRATIDSKLLTACLISGLALMKPSLSQAFEVTPGDYDQFPAGVNIGLLYLQHAESSKFYSNTGKTDNFRLNTDIAVLRYVHPTQLAPGLVIDPQFILPMGSLTASGAANSLGSENGVGDLMLGMPFKYLLDETTRDTLSIGPYLFLPTGDYDKNQSLNLGENRWKFLTQFAYVKHFNANWTLDFIQDVTFIGENDDFGPSGVNRKQDNRYETQAHLRYNISPVTSLALSYGYYWGGEDEIAGVKQNDELGTQYMRATWASFIAPDFQLQLQYGRDLKVNNGFKEDDRINVRIAKIF